MATPTTTPQSLTNEQLVEMLGLIKGADSVELKLTVPETDQRSAIQALEIDPLDAQMRQVVFFDTPDLKLYEHGVVVRARRVQGKGDDSVVKLRPVVPRHPSEQAPEVAELRCRGGRDARRLRLLRVAQGLLGSGAGQGRPAG